MKLSLRYGILLFGCGIPSGYGMKGTFQSYSQDRRLPSKKQQFMCVNDGDSYRTIQVATSETQQLVQAGAVSGPCSDRLCSFLCRRKLCLNQSTFSPDLALCTCSKGSPSRFRLPTRCVRSGTTAETSASSKAQTHPPTQVSTPLPTHSPTTMPSNSPTHSPTNAPSQHPTHLPTNRPTQTPTQIPTHVPTYAPTLTPTIPPTTGPQPEFCWKDSYGRGVGTIPDRCPDDKDQIGALCYSKCPSGYTRFGFDCHQNCPSSDGWRDDGLFCRLSEYGRGFGYAIWDNGSCDNDNGGYGNCETCLAMWYPKCKSGYSPVGCNICRPNVPNCNAMGFTGGIDLSCAKTIKIGDPTPLVCPSEREYDAGLCYATCKSGSTGVGPVCWDQPPNGWVECGFGAAVDSANCAEVTTNQILSVGEVVFFVATMGAGGAAKSIAKGSAQWTKLVQKFQKFQKNLPEAAKKLGDVYDAAQTGYTIYEITQIDPNVKDPEELVRLVTTFTGIFDPTGVSSVLGSYTWTKCTEIK